jgi:REP element-mobilizing transposase RayT
MAFDPQKHHRRSIRLNGYDYTQPGAYFITVVTHDRECLFGEIVDGEMRLNEFGEIVRTEWFKTAVVRPYVMLYPDEFVMMPNHTHGIIWIVDVGATRRVAPSPVAPSPIAPPLDSTPLVHATIHPRGPMAGSVGAIIGQFKSITAKRINALRNIPGQPVWQRNYYEHIIRDERALNAIRRYILNNPANWTKDADYLEMTS